MTSTSTAEFEHESEEGKYLIAEVRRRFLAKGPELNEFDRRDVDRVKQDDLCVWLFLRHKHKDVDKVMEMMTDCLRWRESFGINDLIERNINRRLFEIGFLYPRNVDRNGNPLVLFHTRLYKKDAHSIVEVKKLVAFGLERLAQKYPGGRVTLIFDMQDSGLANMDMDLIKFLITNFQTYFPSMLEYLIVLEMPWILSAAWKIVKTWLSTEGISKIKFVNKTEIFQYVDADQLLVSMGGTDTFKYKYPPQLFNGKNDIAKNDSIFLKPAEPKKDMEFSSLSISINVDPNKQTSPSDMYEMILKKNDEDLVNSVELSLTDSLQKRKRPEDTSSFSKDARGQLRRREVRSSKKNRLEHIGPYVTTCPADEMVFCGAEKTSGEILQILTLTNTISSTVAFKIKTTSPENYRVRPSSGPISPGETAEINIFLQPGHVENVNKDKFLIQSTLVPESEKNTDLGTMWKMIPKGSIMEHRLRCRFEVSTAPIPFTEAQDVMRTPVRKDTKLDPVQALSRHLKDLEKKVDDSNTQICKIERDIRKAIRLLVTILVFLLLIGICIFIILYKDFVQKLMR